MIGTAAFDLVGRDQIAAAVSAVAAAATTTTTDGSAQARTAADELARMSTHLHTLVARLRH